jgi:hypothetical protein
MTHCFCWVLRIGYHACCKCGLLRLRNQMSQAACRAKCRGRED